MTNEDLPPSILAKAFALLQAFTSERRVMRLSEIARYSGLPKSTVHRLLARLIELGAIENHRAGYRIGAMMLQIGTTTPAMGMRDVAAPHLVALHLRTGLTVHLGVLREFDVMILDRVARRNPPSSPSRMGARLPANCTALGKMLLAHEDLDDLAMFLPRPMRALTSASITDVDTLISELREVRASGVARDLQETGAGVASIAAPLTVMGSAVGAVSIAHPVDAQQAAGLETILRDSVGRISSELWAALSKGRVHWFPHEIDDESGPSMSAGARADALRSGTTR
jgi:DNA-binding IclR family transcriptional regulator